MTKGLLSPFVLSLLFIFTQGCFKAPTGVERVNESDASASIIGGEPTTGREAFAKSVVAIYNLKQGALCSGSIISNSLVLTAAHCVYDSSPADLQLIYGTDLNAAETVITKIDAYAISELYPVRKDEIENVGDIALVHFSSGLLPGYKPVRLLGDASLLHTGQPVILAGYGLSDGIEQTGSGLLRSVEVFVHDAYFSASEILVDQTQGKGACHGDSGGPAYLNVGGELFLWGVTSHTVQDPDGTCGGYAAYASVPHFAPWIQATAAKLNAMSPRSN